MAGSSEPGTDGGAYFEEASMRIYRMREERDARHGLTPGPCYGNFSGGSSAQAEQERNIMTETTWQIQFNGTKGSPFTSGWRKSSDAEKYMYQHTIADEQDGLRVLKKLRVQSPLLNYRLVRLVTRSIVDTEVVDEEIRKENVTLVFRKTGLADGGPAYEMTVEGFPNAWFASRDEFEGITGL